MNSTTLEMLSMLPSWMKMRSDPENSTGAKFINAFGMQIYDIERLIDNILAAHHLDMPSNADGIDITEFDILYKVDVQEETIRQSAEVIGYLDEVSYPLTVAPTIYKFYEADEEGVNKYYIDPSTYTIYTKIKVDSISVNGALYTNIIEHSVWGPFDEIGLLLGCPRIPGERNAQYRLRLKDVFQSPGNSTRNGLINYLSRSFGISKDDVEIQELDDVFISSLMNEDGTIKAELKEYLLVSNKINLSSSNVYWDVLEESRAGLSYLPIIWNVPLSKWNNDSIQNGVGDDNDIEVIGPDQDSVTQQFTYHVGLEGLRVARDKIYPEHSFKYRLFATGQKYDDGYKPEDYKYSIIASELIPLKLNVKAHKYYAHDIQKTFDDATVVDYTTVTDADKKTGNYVVKDVVIVPGKTVMNPNNRYIEILANLKTSDKAKTPTINSITLEYSAGGVAKTITFDTQSTISSAGNDITVGFASNTWSDEAPIIKIRNDTNDNYNVLTAVDGSVSLAHGEYQKVYNSEGDWDDGQSTNLRTTSSGTLRLSI